MQFTINLAAGVRQRQQTGGRLFVLISTGAAPSLGVTLWRNTYPLEEITQATRGFKARTADPAGFSYVDLVAPVDCQVSFVISDGAVDFDFVSGSTVTVGNTLGNPVPVTAVTVSDAPAVSASNGVAVACSDVAAVVVAANANRRELRLANIGADQVAIGAAGITWANRCIVLNPGDLWVETRGANLAWSGITDAAKSASVTAQEVLA